MYREFVRDMTDTERETLMARIANPPNPENLRWTLKWGTTWFVVMLVCGTALGAIAMFIESHPVIGGTLASIVGVAGIVFLFCFLTVISHYRDTRRHVRRFLREEVPAIRLALDNGKVDVKHVVATAVIKLEEGDDQASKWLFDIGDGQTLFFPTIRFFDEDEPWPNSEFEIVRSNAGDCVVGVLCHGTMLEPARVIEIDHDRDDVVWDWRERIIKGDVETVAKSLLKRADE